ncbi:MAG: hypothetical protein HDT39_17250 [Lachnospiraceae bacterium]|nr:hypothetical protein [Lachnospiraceae bacterium]
MKLKTTITGIALSFCVAVSSITPIQAKTVNSVTANEVLKEASSTAAYIKGLWESEPVSVTSYRELILMLRSGIDCKIQYNNYKSALSECITDDGRFLFANEENVTLYATAIEILTLGGDNPESFNGANLVKSFNDCLASFTDADELNTKISNPYYYSYIIPAVESYSKEMSDSKKILSLLEKAMFLNYGSDEYGCGINYYGYSTDSNGKVLSAAPYFYRTSPNSAAMIYSALKWTLTLQTEDGGFKFDNGEWSVSSNADSTGYALELLSSYNIADKASEAYKALLTFKSETTPGCYTYSGVDSPYAAVDALEGLISYYLYLDGQNPSPFNVEYAKNIASTKYTVTFKGNKGTINGKSSYKVTVKSGTTIKSPKAIRKGYSFDGWYTEKNSDKKEITITVTSNRTYYAIWSKINVKKATISSVKSTSKKKANVTVKKMSNVTGYEIEYSMKSNFKNSKKLNIKGVKATLTGLKSEKTYYVRVRAYKLDSADKPVYGSFSSAKKIKIK